MATDQGPASNNAEYFFGSTVGLEVHIGNPSSGLNPLGPGYAPYQNDPSTPITFTPINKVVAGNIQFSNPS